jgi:hypothetical protein
LEQILRRALVTFAFIAAGWQPAGAASLDESMCQRLKELPHIGGDVAKAKIKLIGKDAKGARYETDIRVPPYEFCYVYERSDGDHALACELEVEKLEAALELVESSHQCARDTYDRRDIAEQQIGGKFRMMTSRGVVPLEPAKKVGGKRATVSVQATFLRRVMLDVYYYD